jgi:DNA-binding LacI/PurR family transcriptional regulator
LVASDGEVRAVAAALRLLGLTPQHDILLVGYDGYWSSDSDESPFEAVTPLATVDKDNHRIGIELVRLLDARIAGRLPAAAQRILLPPRVIEIPAS